jgi:hypothetical protein
MGMYKEANGLCISGSSTVMEARYLPRFGTVWSVRRHIAMQTQDGWCPPVAVVLCVLSATQLHHSTRYDLIDGGILADEFQAVVRYFNNRPRCLRRRHVLRVIVSTSGGMNPPLLVPGSLLYVEQISELRIYAGICLGVAEPQHVLGLGGQ